MVETFFFLRSVKTDIFIDYEKRLYKKKLANYLQDIYNKDFFIHSSVMFFLVKLDLLYIHVSI